MDVALIPENHQPVHTVFLSKVSIVTDSVPADTNDESLQETSLFVGTELTFFLEIQIKEFVRVTKVYTKKRKQQ